MIHASLHALAARVSASGRIGVGSLERLRRDSPGLRSPGRRSRSARFRNEPAPPGG